MIEIDILKATNHHHMKQLPACYNNDDTDISEPDTALNTPTGSLTDSLARRYSYSSTTSFKRKPSFTPKSPDAQQNELLEKRIQALENDISEHVKREAELQSQVFLLTEQQKGVQYKSTLTRMSKQIDQFLVTHEDGNNNKSSGYWNNQDEWTGNELSNLYEYEQENHNNNIQFDIIINDTNTTTTIPILLIFRLKSILENFNFKEEPIQELTTEINRLLDSWQVFYHKKLIIEKENKNREQIRITKLLEALQKSLLKNKIMKQDHALLIKKYKSDIKEILNIQNKNNKNKEKLDKTCFIRSGLETQIRTLEKDLLKCQDERDEYESTLDMVRKEMETMLEELEDTRQQRLRYKTQASRLRAGLEAIQKKKQNQYSDDEEEEDEGKEAIRLMYNEAERQAIDLDRECKRQALTLSNIRKELKSTQEKYHQTQLEKDNELKILQRTNQRLIRDIEILRIEKHELVTVQQQKYQLNSNDEFIDFYTLQIALKAAKSDAMIQRTKISQLERQTTFDLNQSFIAGLQDLFKKELEIKNNNNNNNYNVNDIQEIKEMAKIIETEQKSWINEMKNKFQKNYDIDLLEMNRELRFLSCKLNDVEDEMIVLKARHLEEISLLKYQSNAEYQKRLQQITCIFRLKEQELKSQLESLFQKNQTLQDESIILYGRNMLMAHELGKIAP